MFQPTYIVHLASFSSVAYSWKHPTSHDDLPPREDHALNPVNPYAVARVSQEMLSKIYVDGYGLDIVMPRSFNHIGPGKKIFLLFLLSRGNLCK